MTKPITKAELDALDKLDLSLFPETCMEIAPRLIADHRRLVELLAKQHKRYCGLCDTPQVCEAAEYLRQWQGK